MSRQEEKYRKFFLCLCILSFLGTEINLLSAQSTRIRDSIKIKPAFELEDIIQSYMESREQDGDFNYNTLYDKLEYLQSHPVNINDEDEIDDLVLLRPSQILNVKNYIKQHGELISIYELQAIPGLDVASIKMIIPFVRLKANFEKFQVPVTEMLKYGDAELFLRTGRYLEDQVGYDPTRSSFYLGNPNRLYLRFKYYYENKLSIGFTSEKDPGEEFFKGSNKHGFDYYSFHFALRNTNKTIKDFIVGDYNLSFGQGLIIHSGFGVGKSPWATNIRKTERTIRPYNSVNESNFLRGFASNININKNTEATMIFSVRKKDGNSVTDSLDRESIFSSFQESGYHRTINEISDENALTETMIGGAVKYKGQYGHIGINSLFTSFNKDFRKQDVPYNQFSFRGTDLFQASLDHSFQLRNFHFFGEAAISNPGTYALMEGLQLSLDKKLDISFLYRKLDKSYPALYSNAFSENTLANNETGFYIGMEMRPTSRWKVSGYWDLWSHPWLRFNVQRPSLGNEQLIRLSYSIRRKMEVYIQFRNKSREENSTLQNPIRPLADYTKKSLRINFNYLHSKSIETRSRIEFSAYSKSNQDNQHGYMIFQDILYQSISKPISFSSRIAYYNTDSYDSGIYAYENDLLYNFYVPNYNGKGWRYYLNTQYTGIRNLSLEARYAITKLNGAESIGSGLDKIIGNKRSEVKLQVRWKF